MFERDSEKRSWAREQMTKAGVPSKHQLLIEKLLGIYWQQAAQNEYDPKTAEIVLEVFSELAKGHTLVPESEEEVWVAAKSGSLSVGEEIRVKRNAYDGPAGLVHNGRRGVITAIRYGDIHVRYTDGEELKTPFIKHSPNSLEKRVK